MAIQHGALPAEVATGTTDVRSAVGKFGDARARAEPPHEVVERERANANEGQPNVVAGDANKAKGDLTVSVAEEADVVAAKHVATDIAANGGSPAAAANATCGGA